MPRDSAGHFSLVPGNPVQSGTVVSSTWANSTLDDVSTALTDSLDRYGRGGMLAPFKFSDGTNLLPGAAWVNEPTTGFYRFDAGDLRAVVLTQDVMRWQSTGAQVWNSTDLQWNDIVGGGSGQTGVDPGTAADNTLRWSGTAWVETSDLTVSSAGVVSAVGGLESEGAGTDSFRAGTSAGSVAQGDNTVAVGARSGENNQGATSTALGYRAAEDDQGTNATAVGDRAGNITQGDNAVAVGSLAGQTTQSSGSVAVGVNAGKTTQGGNSTAVGNQAGENNQGLSSVAVGIQAAETEQGNACVAVGKQAGQTDQSNNAVAVGSAAGKTAQGSSSVSVGYLAGETSQGANGIIINSSGAALDDTTAGHIHIASDDGSLDFLTASGWSMSADLSVTGTVDSTGVSTGARVRASANGSAGGPSFTWSTDTDTGTYRVSSGVIGFSSNGTEVMTVGATVETGNGELVGATEIGVPTQAKVNSMMSVTQAEYDAIGTPDANTLYFIVG